MMDLVRHIALGIAIAGCLASTSPRAQTIAAPGANPGEAEVEAVLGPQTAVSRTAPGIYVIDGDHVTIADLMGKILPEKEATLKALRESIRQRTQTADAANSGMSVDAKRALCQKMPLNSIDRTRCYQELVALREHQTQSAQQVEDEAKDNEDQADKLDRQIEAIDQFRQQYGVASPVAK